MGIRENTAHWVSKIDYDHEPWPDKARPRLAATRQSEVVEARQSVAATKHMMMMTEVMRRGASNGEVAMTVRVPSYGSKSMPLTFRLVLPDVGPGTFSSGWHSGQVLAAVAGTAQRVSNTGE